MPSVRIRVLLGLGAIGLTVVGLLVVPFLHQAKRTAEAYLFGYPLVLMELTKASQASKGHGTNTFLHLRSFPDPNMREVVAPNADTLYSAANLDLRAEPVVLHIPNTAGRFYIMPLMDAWTNVFASPGTRTIGEVSKDYLITGPGWNGAVPEGLERIAAPTNMVWLVGRLKSAGPSDFAQINALQDRFKLQPLSAWSHSQPAPEVAPMADGMPSLQALPPDQQLEHWSLDDFFRTFCQVLRSNPARPADAEALRLMEEAGLLTNTCSVQFSRLQRLGAEFGYSQVIRKLSDPQVFVNKAPTTNGWSVNYELGEYGTRYDVRALVAKIGLGALGPQDSIYPRAVVDAQGQPLNGNHRYRLHFAAGQLPPANAFWSLTLYNTERFFAANTLNRYAIGDRNPLVSNADGSLDLLIQADPPDGPMTANWLPAPRQPIELILRLYWPKTEVLEHQWVPPAIERLD